MLANPVARRLLVTQSLSEAGDYVGLSALMLLAFGRTGNVVGSAAILAVNALPSLLVGTVFSSWLDRPERRSALVGLALVGALVTGTAGVFPYLAMALAAAAVLGAMRTAAVSITMAVVVDQVPEAIRPRYFGLTSGINMAAQTIGFLVGALVTVGIGVRPALAFDAATFLVGALLLSRLPSIRPKPRARRPPALQGLKTVFATPILLRITPVVWVAIFVSGFPEAVAPGVAKGSALPLLLAAWSFGTLCSSLGLSGAAFLRQVSGQLRLALAFGLTFAVGALVLVLKGSAWWLLPVNVALGLLSVFIVGVRATFARCTPPERMAQVEATMVSSNNLFGGIGTLALAGMAAAVSPDLSYAAAGLLVTVGVLVAVRREPADEPQMANAADPVLS